MKSERMYSSSYSRPTSSNATLGFYQITTLEVLEKLTQASFNQNAAKTAKQMLL
jgi:hypothetical protein